MAATQQALLMASDNAVTVPEACEADPYYSCGPTNDPYWANVVLLLHFDGDLVDEKGHAFSADGTTFTASGKFADAVDIGGTAVTGGGANVVYLDTATTDLWLDDGDFTIEGWVKNNATDNNRPRTLVALKYGSDDYVRIGINETGETFLGLVRTGVSTSSVISTSIVATTGVWFHVALTRNGDTYKYFVNGVDVGSTTSSYRIASQNISCFVGNSARSFVDALCGEIDDLRITKGVARYTGNFNIPTAAFPDALDTDYFATGVVYNNQAGYFPSEAGSTNGATFTSDKSGEFTWVVPASANAFYTRTPSPIRLKSYCEFVCTTQPATMTHGFGVQRANVGQFYDAKGGMIFSGNGGCGLGAAGYSNEGVETTNAAYSFTTNDVIGVAYDPFTGKLWFSKNGAWISGDPEAGTSPTMTLALGEYYFAFGAYSCLIASGTYIYKIQPSAENQTYPAPVGFIEYADYIKARTILSLHAEDLEDSSCYQPKTVTLAGTASVTDIAQKFGTYSFAVANTGSSTANGVVITDHQDFDFGTGDFTIEMWAYRSSNTYYGTLFYFTEAAEFSLLVAPTTGNIVLNYRSSGGTQANISTGVTFPLTTWQHVVVQRRGTNFEFYLEGVLGNTTAITGGASSTVNSTGDFYLGRTNASSALTWAGYIDEVRITKGVARYTAAFDPATMPNCDSVVPGNIVAVPGTSPLTGMSVTVRQQTIGDQNGAVALSGVSATVNAGGLFSDSVTSSKTVALLGRSVTVSRGTLAVPAYPNLISVSTTTIEAVATGNTAKLTFTFFTDGTYTVVDQALTTRTSGTWIDTAQTNYSIPAISNQYRVVTINIFAGTSYTYSTLPFTLGTSFSVVIQNLASSTLNIFDFQLTISPTSTNPRYAEPYYYGTHRFKAVLSNDMS